MTRACGSCTCQLLRPQSSAQRYVCVCMYEYVYTHMHAHTNIAYVPSIAATVVSTGVCMCVYMYEYVYTHMHTGRNIAYVPQSSAQVYVCVESVCMCI
jgi:hypothetical protein